MNEYINAEISEIAKEHLISLLTDELPVLRAKIAISQDELSNLIGVSRQTYSAIETNKRKMSWNTFLSLILVFGYNEKTAGMLESCGAFPDALRKSLNNLDKSWGGNSGTASSRIELSRMWSKSFNWAKRM